MSSAVRLFWNESTVRNFRTCMVANGQLYHSLYSFTTSLVACIWFSDHRLVVKNWQKKWNITDNSRTVFASTFSYMFTDFVAHAQRFSCGHYLALSVFADPFFFSLILTYMWPTIAPCSLLQAVGALQSYIVLCVHYCLCMSVFSCFRCFLCIL